MNLQHEGLVTATPRRWGSLAGDHRENTMSKRVSESLKSQAQLDKFLDKINLLKKWLEKK